MEQFNSLNALNELSRLIFFADMQFIGLVRSELAISVLPAKFSVSGAQLNMLFGRTVLRRIVLRRTRLSRTLLSRPVLSRPLLVCNSLE